MQLEKIRLEHACDELGRKLFAEQEVCALLNGALIVAIKTLG
jgi:hypothetical protein